MYNTEKIEEMLAATINSMTPELIENAPKEVSGLVKNYSMILDNGLLGDVLSLKAIQKDIQKYEKEKHNYSNQRDILNHTYNGVSSMDTDTKTNYLHYCTCITNRERFIEKRKQDIEKDYSHVINLSIMVDANISFLQATINTMHDLYIKAIQDNNIAHSTSILNAIKNIEELLKRF